MSASKSIRYLALERAFECRYPAFDCGVETHFRPDGSAAHCTTFIGGKADLVAAGLVDEATLARLWAHNNDARHACVRDEFGREVTICTFGPSAAVRLVFHDYDDVAEPRGMHGVSAERTFRRLWRRIAQPKVQR